MDRVEGVLGIKDAILRGDGSTIAAGHPVLGCPVGTDAYVENVIRASAKRAAALIPILDLLLISKDSGSHAPDERDLLIRLCVCRGKQNNRRRWGRRGSLDEGVGASPPVVYSSSEASSDGKAKGHPDHRGEPGCSPRGLGGHGTLLHVNIDSLDPSASHHDVAYYGSMAAVWHYIRAWVVPLKGRCLAHRPIAGPGCFWLSAIACLCASG